jgi:hypothetical protein
VFDRSRSRLPNCCKGIGALLCPHRQDYQRALWNARDRFCSRRWKTAVSPPCLVAPTPPPQPKGSRMPRPTGRGDVAAARVSWPYRLFELDNTEPIAS